MAIVIRLYGPYPVSVQLRAIMLANPSDYELECWSEGEFHCPHCSQSVGSSIGNPGGPVNCPACGLAFWMRWLPWAAAITSTDDPSQREGHQGS